jgi:heat shock protein HslJ
MSWSRGPLVAVVAAAVAVVGSVDEKARAAEAAPLAGTAWMLAELPGRTLPARTLVTLRFERERVTIQDGCSQFKAPYKAEGGTLEVVLENPTLRMDCPPERTEIAHVFLTALEGARTYKVEGGRLQLLATGGDVLATLVPQAAKTRAATSP